ncbi:MAG: succinylglutamate-semialdehyde dehydrogenase, partial [Pseudomonadota bacterium]
MAGLIINGADRAGAGPRFEAIAPHTQAPSWAGNAADADDVADAVAAARGAFERWRKEPLDARIALLQAFKGELETRKDDFARAISDAVGKPKWEADTEAAAVIGKIDISIRAYEERTGERESDAPAGRAVLRHRPLGVMAVLGPFNFPAHLANGHIVPAVLAGNAVVFKPSELAPAPGAMLVDAWRAAGAPAGLVNLVQGGRETGEALSKHPDLNGVLFTGGVDAGLALHRQFAGRPDVMLALELGGNNPLVVWETVDAEAAAYAIVQSAYLTAGQRCTCARRLILPTGDAGDRIVEALAAMIDRIRIGAPYDDPDPFMGPVINDAAADRVVNVAADLVAAGGVAIRTPTIAEQSRAFVTPGLIDVTAVVERKDEEVFGPLLQVIRVKTFNAAIDEANDTRFGLSAGLIADDPALWERFRA